MSGDMDLYGSVPGFSILLDGSACPFLRQYSADLKKKNLFYIGVLLTNNTVIVSGGQQRDSAICTHVSILPQTLLPSGLPFSIEQSSLCYTVGPFWLSILNIAECTF